MADSHSTATPETTNAAPTANPPVRENQRAVEAEVEQGAITFGTAELNAGQRVMRSVGGGSPAASPDRFAGALGQMQGASAQAGMLRQLQRSYGNSYVGRVIQAKLTVNQPGDVYEQEADRMAAQVMTMAAAQSTPSIQREMDPKKEKEKIQMLPSLQRAADGDLEAGSNLESQLNSSKGRGSPLSDDVRSFMEPRFGADFSQVRAHTGSEAIQMNRDLNAQAFTHKRDIYFGAGKEPAKDALTAHELTHVTQQIGGQIQPSIQRKERSWIDERIDWVRTATLIGNWDKADPPGAYYVLNGLSIDDMVRVLRALTAVDRKKLSDNLDEKGAGFDRSRLKLALTNAAVPAEDKAFRESSENLLWAIRSGNYTNPPDGAFYQLVAAKGQQRDRLLAALNRDALDALISHKDEAGAVPGGAEVVDNIQGSRARVGQTSREKRLHDLIEGNDFKAFFTEFNAMNETDELRFLMSADLVDISKIRDHIGAAAGIADQDRLLNLLQRATTTASKNLYIDASTATYHWQPKYRVDNPDDLSRFIRFTDAFDVEIDINTISDAELGEDDAERQFQAAKPGPGGFLWPANRNRSTLPNLWNIKQDIHKAMWTALFDPVLRAGIFVVQYLLNVVFPTVHGAVMRTLGALRRASLSTRWMQGSKVLKAASPPIFGGETTEYVELYRYTNQTGPQSSGSFWTDFATTSAESASQMTGVPKELIKYRLALRVNMAMRYKLFRDAGTKLVQGAGSGIEYKSNVPVPEEFITVQPL